MTHRCQHCVWSGNADILSAFCVVDCGRHKEGDQIGYTATTKMREAMLEWADKLAVDVYEELESSRDVVVSTQPAGSPEAPPYDPASDHDTDIPMIHAKPYTTRDIRSITALLDEGAERIRALEDDVRRCRTAIEEYETELKMLKARVRR